MASDSSEIAISPVNFVQDENSTQVNGDEDMDFVNYGPTAISAASLDDSPSTGDESILDFVCLFDGGFRTPAQEQSGIPSCDVAVQTLTDVSATDSFSSETSATTTDTDDEGNGNVLVDVEHSDTDVSSDEETSVLRMSRLNHEEQNVNVGGPEVQVGGAYDYIPDPNFGEYFFEAYDNALPYVPAPIFPIEIRWARPEENEENVYSVMGLFYNIIWAIVNLPFFLYEVFCSILQVELPSIRETVEIIMNHIMRMVNFQTLHDDRAAFTQNEINNLTILEVTARHIAIQEECAVCFVRYEVGQQIYELPCRHFFHTECLSRWLLIRADCPLCRGLARRQGRDDAWGENEDTDTDETDEEGTDEEETDEDVNGNPDPDINNND